MTSIVGVLCQDGVVIGTDSAATFGGRTLRTIEQSTEKLDIIGGEVVLAGVGSTGLRQRFRDSWTPSTTGNVPDIPRL